MQNKDPILEEKWEKLEEHLSGIIGKKPRDLNAILFIIGAQELGAGIRSYSKEEKQDLMHIAVCKVLSLSGYYTLEGLDEEGWPHWRLEKKLPHFDLLEQEVLLKSHIIEYFEKDYGVTLS